MHPLQNLPGIVERVGDISSSDVIVIAAHRLVPVLILLLLLLGPMFAVLRSAHTRGVVGACGVVVPRDAGCSELEIRLPAA